MLCTQIRLSNASSCKGSAMPDVSQRMPKGNQIKARARQNLHPSPSPEMLLQTLHSRVCFFRYFRRLHLALLFSTWRFIFSLQTNRSPLSNHSLTLGQTLPRKKKQKNMLPRLSVMIVIQEKVGVGVSEAMQTAEELEAETKFTSLRCHPYRSTSSVVMVTPVMREGLFTGPEGQPGLPRAAVRQTTLQG